ncbi:hypothetical protein [Rodentibacter trehalosifermentans]|uniref:hypothetical protein n=1 Tax=Rodentibacter trehalosifermentans TaxID=1908263 RepID=UPI0009849549|nr:hypothetical protein [Rodentibacter trehalosifermentans]OOF48628.1 hypothetical protein BKK53_09485 [Rodentibacter trehalosifermentans]
MDIQASVKKVLTAGFIDSEGIAQAWDEKSISLQAVASCRFQCMLSPFEIAIIKQLALDNAVDFRPSESRTGRILIRKALGLCD